MLTKDQLVALLAEAEADHIERTESVSNTDKFSQAICAFANDMSNRRQPGYLLVGVKDNGTLSGLRVTDELLLTLSAIRSDGNVLPQPALTVTKFEFEAGDVAVVEVFPSDLPPVRYKGKVWIRVGPRKGSANEQEERILTERRMGMARTFDALPCTEATLQDVAVGQFESYRQQVIDAETIAENHRPLADQMGSLRLYDPKRASPTNAGLLLFGKNPRYFLPGAYVQYIKMPGTELHAAPDDQAEISGDLVTVLRELETRVRLLIQTRMRAVGTFEEKLLPDYPEWALRELLMNAVMHRNYESNTPIHFYAFSDRIEIQNSGGLYGDATPENFPSRNSYRNPVIAEAMKSLGYVNRFGSGVGRAKALLKKNGNPEPEFEFDANSVLVTIRKSVA